MTAYLTQQRLRSFALGTAAAAALYLMTRRDVRRVTAEMAAPGAAPPPPPPLVELPQVEFYGSGLRAKLVRRWNESVDAAFKPVIEALSRRGL